MNSRRSFTFFEFDGFKASDGQLTQEQKDLGLRPDELRYLQAISDPSVTGKRIFDWTPTKVKARSLVGIISFANIQIEILPKLLAPRDQKGVEVNSLLNNLMFMLSYTNALEAYDTGPSVLGSNKDSFIEIYISVFEKHLSKFLIQNGVPKQYLDLNENLRGIKGRIDFPRDVVLNSVDRSRTACEFSEFYLDNSLSRAFKYVAGGLRNLTKSSDTKLKLERCLGFLDGVTIKWVDPDLLSRIPINKRGRNYQAIVELTKMFLKKLRPEFNKINEGTVFALLFDMNELFEEFIFQVLRRNESFLGINVEQQKKRNLVTAERERNDIKWKATSLFNTYTDIIVKFKGNRPGIIIDTKYKIIGSESNYGIANTDAYQVLAYKQIHSSEIASPKIALVYPTHDVEIHKEFQVNGGPTSFIAFTIDISRDLKLEMPKLVTDLAKLLNAT